MSSAGCARATAPPARLPPARLRLRRSSEARPPLSRAAVAPSTAPSTLGLESVKNTRDLADAFDGVAPGRVFRTATPGGASAADAVAILDDLGVTALLDLRSEDELRAPLSLGAPRSSSSVSIRRLSAPPRVGVARLSPPALSTPRALPRAPPRLRPVLRAHIREHERVGEGPGGGVHRSGEARGRRESAPALRREGQRRRPPAPQRGDARELGRRNPSRPRGRGARGRGPRGPPQTAGESRRRRSRSTAKPGRTSGADAVAALALKCCGASDAEVVADYRRSDAATGGVRWEGG